MVTKYDQTRDFMDKIFQKTNKGKPCENILCSSIEKWVWKFQEFTTPYLHHVDISAVIFIYLS